MKTQSKKLSSLTIFFPFFNDAGSVKKAISNAYYYGEKVADDLEVIAIHGGKSVDDTYKKILKEKAKHPDLIVLDKHTNKEGYAVIKYGLKKATKDWIFYTDGDLQYDVAEIEQLVNKQIKSRADIVNGFKKNRADSVSRQWFGRVYRLLSRIFFHLPIRDVDCDFRLIRRDALNRFKLASGNSSILLELIKKLEVNGATFAEIPVHHYKRTYGSSNYTVRRLFFEKIIGDITFFYLFYIHDALYHVFNLLDVMKKKSKPRHVTKEIKKPA